MSSMFRAGSGLTYRVATIVFLASASFAGAVLNPGGRALAQGTLVAPGLVLPPMNAENGKHLFASKGCVVCHEINGIGGRDAASLDEKTMTPIMNPFDFFAKMWLGAMPMIAMQNHELGHQIELTGQDLADIVAFVHNRTVQQTFSEKDIPDEIKALMKKDQDSNEKMEMNEHQGGRGMMKREH